MIHPIAPGDWVLSRFSGSALVWPNIEERPTGGWRMCGVRNFWLKGWGLVIAACTDRTVVSDAAVYAVLLLVDGRLGWVWSYDLRKA